MTHLCHGRIHRESVLWSRPSKVEIISPKLHSRHGRITWYCAGLLKTLGLSDFPLYHTKIPSLWDRRFKTDLPDLVGGFAVTRVPAHKIWKTLEVRPVALFFLSIFDNFNF